MALERDAAGEWPVWVKMYPHGGASHYHCRYCVAIMYWVEEVQPYPHQADCLVQLAQACADAAAAQG